MLDALPETVADWRAAQATAAWGLREGRLKPLDLEDRPRPGNGSTAPPDSGGEAPTPDLKRPLFRPLPAAPAFPMEALGELRRPAEAIQVRTQAPAAICAQSVLAATTLAAQAHRDVELPGCGRRPLTGLYGSVAESGERKTTVDRQALAPAYRVEEQWRGEREGQISGFVNDVEAWKAAREAAKKKHKGDRVAIKAALDAIGAEPKPPPQAMLLVEDFSPEALVLHLRDSRPWAGVFTSEGGVLVGGHVFNAEKAMATAALLNCLWDGSPIRRVRVLTGNAFLPGRRCSSHIMMQPVVAARLLGDAMLDGIGLMARLLVVDPESTVGHRPFREATAECAEILREYMARMTTLLTRPSATAPDAPDVLDPPAMKLTGAARDLWVRFHDAVERDLRSDGALHPIRAFGAKMAEHAGRLAAVLTVYADPDAMDVDEAAMACGIRLAQHYAAEMLRLQGSASVSPDLRLADRLLGWWQKRPDPQCYLAQIYQRGLNAIGDAATARRIVTILVEHGWLRPLKPGIVIDGVHRREAWTLVP
ncbi:MAG: YfjI family protein [Rhodopila sp.]